MSYDSERSFSYESPSFQSRYSYYDGSKHERDYLYPVTRHANISRFIIFTDKTQLSNVHGGSFFFLNKFSANFYMFLGVVFFKKQILC